MSWATGPNSFVVVGLLEAPGFSEVAELKKKLNENKSDLVKAAGQTDAGSDGGKRGKTKARNHPTGKDTRGNGNAGATILLRKLEG